MPRVYDDLGGANKSRQVNICERNNMHKVRLFIVGAAKCGTTSLHAAMSRHPLVTMSTPKEPNYFSSADLLGDKDYYYKEDVIASIEDYEKCFTPGGEFRGEASATYLHSMTAPCSIYAYNPAAKIVILTRDPVMRAWSHYLMDQRLGYCDDDLEDILDDPVRYRKYYKQYIEIGMYSRYIDRYIEIFGADSVMLLALQDLKNNPRGTYKKLCEFVGIEYDPVMLNVTSENTFLRPRFACIAMLYKSSLLRKYYRKIAPSGLTRFLKKIVFSKQGKPDMPSVIKERLRSIYAASMVTVDTHVDDTAR